MKLIDMIKIGIKEFYKNKANYFNTIFISIAISIVIFCLAFSNSLNNYWNQSVKKMVDYRTFFVYYDPNEKTEKEALTELQSYNTIESISPYTSYIINMRMFEELNNTTEINLFLFGVPKNTVTISNGNNIDNYNSSDKVMVCPENIFYEYKKGNKTEKKEINLNNLLGKQISLKFIDDDNKIENFKLIGTYDSSMRQGKENFCYTNSDIVTNLNLYYQPEAFKEEEGIIYPLIVRLKSTDNIQETLKKFEKDHFYTNGDPVVKIDTTIGNKILNLITLISLLVGIISIIVIILISIKNQYNQNKKYAIFKTIGYNRVDIIKLQCIESFFCILVTLVLILIITTFIIFVFQRYYVNHEEMLYGLKSIISKFNIVLGISFCIIINILLALIRNNKVKKNNIMEELKS